MMDKKQIADFIRTSGIGIDPITLKHTLSFLQNHVGNLSVELQHYQILSAAAIAGETIVLNDVTQTKRAKSGITLEHVMRHIGNLSKQLYLQVLTRQVQKWRQAPLWLKTKTYNIQISYRIYKKYRSVFDELCQQRQCFEETNKYNIMAIFWIVYLFIKSQNSQFDNSVQTITLLHSIVLFIFSQIEGGISHKQSSTAFRQQFGQSKMPSEEKYTLIRTFIVNKLNDIHNYRFKDRRIDIKQLSSTEYSYRYLDDSSDLYQKFIQKLPENTINQIYFLEFKKDLSPCPIQKRETNKQRSITRLLDLTISDDDGDGLDQQQNQDAQKGDFVQEKQLDNTSRDHFFKRVRNEPASPFRAFPSKELTPVSSRHLNSNWLNGITSATIKEETDEVRRIYQKYVGENYSKAYEVILKLIVNSIYQFTPECMDFIKRQHQIYQLYSYCTNRIAETHTPLQMVQIFSKFENYCSILCLTSDLFNYANQGLEGSYAKYCTAYQVTILQGHKAINWFGKHISLPKALESYIYAVQKKILIEEIWHNNQGFFLLNKEQRSKEDIQLIKRLQKHVNERTQQLCFKMNILDSQIIKVVNLVKYILHKRIVLLKNHRIDQIIVCSIGSILSINRSHSKYTLQQIFDHYNQLIYSFYSNKNDLYDSDGNRIDLINFYNEVFLPSVEDIVNGEDNQGILSTPVRLQRQKSKQLGLQMTPLSQKFREKPKVISIPRIKFTEDELERDEEKTENHYSRKPFYRQGLRSTIKNSLKQIKEPERSGDDQSSSPTFRVPEFERGFSFGKFDSK